MPTPARDWTPAQRDAITHAGGGLLVSAAAGSGKTSVLAERCAHLVCDAAEPCSVHELLVVTFTEAAAIEMKGRIARALADRHAARPDNDHLARQLSLIDRASISTLHGFCARLLRQHFHVLGLDPAFRIFDGDEATLLKQEVARNLFADRYDAAEGDGGREFRDLIDLYGDGDDERLMGEVMAVHDTLGSVVDPAGWMARTRAAAAEVAAAPLKDTALGRAFIDGLKRELAGVVRECEAAGKYVKSLGGFDGYVTHLRELFAVAKHLSEVLASDGLDAVAEVAKGIAVPRLRPVSSLVPDKELAKGRVDAVNALIKEGPWRRRLAFAEATWRAGMAATTPHVDTLLSLVDDYGEAYRLEKDEQGGLDFNDLERLTLKLLGGGDDGTGGPSAVARAYHTQFRHVMVDEFQDINEVQDAILTRVSREGLGRAKGSNLFCVGDVKQSIYRFRLADPARFLARRATYAADADRGRVIDLQQNFRSRGPLLDAVNGVFERLMTADAADLDYDESQRLVVGAKWPAGDAVTSFTGSPIELHLLPKSIAGASVEEAEGEDAADLDRSQREAVLVGHRVLEMVGKLDRPAMTVVDRDGTVRPVRCGDVVVLLRSMRFKADTYAKQLRAMGVPVHAQSSTGYFEAVEVNDVLSLLRVLDNGRQDVPLAAVLRSPIANLPAVEDALARIRIAYPLDDGGEAVPFHVAVRRYAAEQHDELAAKLTDVLNQLAAWRQTARDRPVAELLWAVYTRTGYLAFVGGLPRGEQRQANLVELHERARQFGTFRRQGLGRFLVFLERLRAESDLGQASVASEADDVVRIMSIHKSKGLEFPVVIVPDLGKLINVADLNGSILMDRDLGLGLRVVDDDRQVRYPSLAWTVVQQRLRQQTLAEELRVLYVALTRAKEHLILIGTTDESAAEGWRQQWADHAGPFPAEMVLAARSPLDWVGPAAASLPSMFEVVVHDAEDVAESSQAHAAAPVRSPDQAARADLDPLVPEPPVTAAAAAVIDRIGRKYPYEPAAATEAATAVTTLTKAAGTGPAVERVLDLPRFVAGEATVTAVDRGSATHAVLERMSFAAATSAEAVRAEVAKLAAARRITDAQADAVDVDAILWLMSTDVGGLLRDGRARREVPIYFAHGTTGGMDDVMVRGRVDALVPDGGGWLVVDYKTDRVSGDGVAARADTYAGQMDLYAAAVAKVTGRPAVGWALVFLHGREIVRPAGASGRP